MKRSPGCCVRLSEADRRRLTAAMATIEGLFGAARAPTAAVLREPRPGDMGWVVQSHGAQYASEYGFDSSFEALVAEIAAKFLNSFDASRERCWIAEIDGAPVGSVFLVRHDDEVAKLRLLLVEPAGRGHGLGRAAGRRMHCVCARLRLSQDHALDPKHSDGGPQDLSGRRLCAGGNRTAPQFRPKPDRRDLGDETLVRPFRSIDYSPPLSLFATQAAFAADIRVMISSGFHGAYSEIGSGFRARDRKSSDHDARPSMGDSPEAIPARLSRGESADVVILDGGAADELGKRGFVQADSKVELARSLIGMVVREGAAKPDISSVDALRNTLLAAKSIAYSDSGSGTYLSTILFQKLGVADQIARQEPESARTAVRRTGGGRGRARRGGNRLPAGGRTHPCSRRYLRRRAAGRGAAEVFLCRRSHQERRASPTPRARCCFSVLARGSSAITKAGLKPLSDR